MGLVLSFDMCKLNQNIFKENQIKTVCLHTDIYVLFLSYFYILFHIIYSYACADMLFVFFIGDF